MKVVVVCFKTEEVDVFNENRLVTFYFKTGKKYEGKIEGEYIKIKISEDVGLTVTEDFFINHFYVADSSSEEDIELNKNYVLKMDTVLFKKGDVVTAFAKSYNDRTYFVSKEDYKKEYEDDAYKYQGVRVECLSNFHVERLERRRSPYKDLKPIKGL